MKYIILLLALLLVASCGESDNSTEVKTTTHTIALTDFLETASEMKVSAGRENFWKIVDEVDIANNTLSSEIFKYKSKSYELPSVEDKKYQITMEALDLDGFVLGRGISKLIDTENLESNYKIFMTPLNKAISTTSEETGLEQSVRNLKGHTVTNLPDGRVLIVGGEDASGFTSRVFVYSPDTQTAQELANNNKKRAYHTATFYYANPEEKTEPRVLISGGYNIEGYVSNAEIYDPSDNSIRILAPQPISARINQAAVLSPKGFIYLFGGKYINNESEIYSSDIVLFNTYQEVFSTSSDSLLTNGVENATANYIGGNKVIIAGGNDANKVYKQVYSFDVDSRKIEEIGILNTARTMHKSVLYNNKVYFVGGFSTISGTNFSEPVSQIEAASASTVFDNVFCQLSKARGRFAMNFVNAKSIIISGGDNGDKNPILESEIVKLDKNRCDRYVTTISLNNPRHSSESVLTTTGLSVIVGGTSQNLSSDATPVEIIAVDPRYFK